MVAASFVQIPQVKATSNYEFNFVGPLDEDNVAGFLPENVTVTVHFANGSGGNPSFNFTLAYTYQTNDTVLYFAYDWNGTGTPQHREYWIDPADNVTGGYYRIYFSNNQMTTYTISFLDYVGILKVYPYIEAQVFFNGAYLTVEKRLVDVQNIVTFDLQEGSRYRLVFGDGTTKTVYGDITTTATAGIQLVLRGVDFPKATLDLYQYVHAYAIRDFLTPTGSITVSYEDITNNTNSVQIVITETGKVNITGDPNSQPYTYTWNHIDNNTVVFNETFTGAGNQTFSYTWLSADNATDYLVTVNIDHASYGPFHFSQQLNGRFTRPTDPFSLSFAGSLPINTAYFIPALIIIFVAGCFSELTSEAAAVLTTIIAIILTWLGWIPITSGALVAALSLSIMAGIVTARRRLLM